MQRENVSSKHSSVFLVNFTMRTKMDNPGRVVCAPVEGGADEGHRHKRKLSGDADNSVAKRLAVWKQRWRSVTGHVCTAGVEQSSCREPGHWINSHTADAIRSDINTD